MEAILPDGPGGHGVSCRAARSAERMPVPGTCLIVLSGEEEAMLAARARSVRSQYRDRLRARIVLAAAFIEHGTRRMHLGGVTANPHARRLMSTRAAGHRPNPIFERDKNEKR